MQIGIFARTFAATGALPVLQAVAQAGYATAQFNLACLGGESMPESIAAAVAAEVAEASRVSGIRLAAVSGTFNMIHPDPAKRANGLARLATIIRAAPAMATRLVTLCTGTRDPDDQWKHHPDNQGAEAWRELLRSMGEAIALAEANDVDLGVEPELANVVSSAAAARRLIDELGSSRIGIVLDPANLFEVAPPEERRDIVARAVDLLGDRIVMAHAKDRRADGAFAAAGAGVVDFEDFVRRLRGVGFDGPLVTHGLDESQAAGVAAFLGRIVGAAAAA